MLTISKPLKGSRCANYYLNHDHADYYINGVDAPGYWHGTATKTLGLTGKLDGKTFQNLLDGFTPDRKSPLVQNAGSEHRQCGWDLTFSAPKSVSIIWALSSPEIREQVEAAHQSAVTSALDFIERVAGVTRRGPNGEITESAALAFATFQHGTSREQDPQLHTHAVLLNLGLRQDGTSGTIQSRPTFRQKMTAGMLYQVELAAALQSRLNVTVKPDHCAFHVNEVPKQLCRQFSKRRQEIEKLLNQRGESDAVAAQRVALASRKTKQNIPHTDLVETWQKQCEAYGWNSNHIQTLTRQQEQKAPQRIDDKQFEQDFQKIVSAIPPEKRTPQRLTRELGRMAIQLGAESSFVDQELSKLNLTSSATQNHQFASPKNTLNKDVHSQWDTTFNAPESVSVLWALSPPNVREQIEQAQQSAAIMAATYLELTIRSTQVEFQKDTKEPMAPAFALSQHGTLNTKSPQLQIHAKCINSNTNALDAQHLDLPREKLTAIMLYQAEFAAALQNQIKLTVEPAADGFRVRGVPKELCREISRQCPDTHQGRASSGNDNCTKMLDPQFLEKWREESESVGWTPERIQNWTRQQGAKESQRTSSAQFEEQFQEAASKIPPRERTFLRLARLARELAIHTGAGASILLAELMKLNAALAQQLGKAERSMLSGLANQRLVYVEWRKLFPKAPSWSPASAIKAPVLSFSDKKHHSRPRRWGRIIWRKNLGIAELRLQMRPLFPKAPDWSVAQRAALPALRLASKPAKYTHLNQSQANDRSH